MQWGTPIGRQKAALLLPFALAALLSFSARVKAADPIVTLEVATAEGFDPTDAREWTEMLAQAGFANVRLRGATKADEPKLETRGTGASQTHHVIGILTDGGQLVLPRGKFAISDRARLEAWLARLREAGEEGITMKPAAFGLLPKQLVALHEALAVPVNFSTAGQKPQEVAKRIAAGLSHKFVTDPASQRALAAGDAVADELRGVSSGTALAAVLRPLGLVLVPEKSGIDVKLRISDSRAAREHWPVGWPPKGNPRETLPELFTFLNVEVAGTPLYEALPAIGGRLKAPVLVDHNSLARGEISLDTKVDLARVNTFYGRALDRILQPAKLRYELRVDEAGKPLLWITTVRDWSSE